MRRKIRLENFEWTDAEGIAAHLTNMAAKGWRLESIGTTAWRYRKAEPAQLTYAVTYLPSGSVYEEGTSEKDYAAYCKEAGWQWVTRWAKMQILCTEDPNPVPLETDEAVRLDAVRTSLRRCYLPGALLILTILVLGTVGLLFGLFRTPIQSLADNTLLLLLLATIPALSYEIWNLISYGRWARNARRAAVAGGNCPPIVRHGRWLLWIAVLLMVIALAAQLQDTARTGAWWKLSTGLFLLFLFALRTVMDMMGATRKAQIAAIAVCGVLFVLADTAPKSTPLPTNVEAPPPVSLQALYPDEPEPYYVWCKEPRSVLLDVQDWRLYSGNEDFGNICDYQIYQCRFSWVRDLCLGQLPVEDNAWQEIVPGVDETWVWETTDGDLCGQMQKGNTILRFSLYVPPTASQPLNALAAALSSL